MSKSFKDHWPTTAIPERVVLQAMDTDTGNLLLCPRCCGRRISLLRTRESTEDVGRYQCDACDFFGTAFDVLVEHSGNSYETAFNAIRAVGFKVPKTTSHKSCLRDYQLSRASLLQFRGLDQAMEGRRIQTNPNGLKEHLHPMWWMTTCREIESYVGRNPVTERDVDAANDPIQTVPLYDSANDVIGVVANRTVYRARGRRGGIGLRHTLQGTANSTDKRAYLIDNSTAALSVQRTRLFDHNTTLPLVFVDLERNDDVGEIVKNLPVRDWVMSFTTYAIGDVLASSWILASRLNAKVSTHVPNAIDNYRVDDKFVQPWYPPLEILATSAPMWKVRAAMVGLRWQDYLRERIKGVWKKTTIDKIDKIANYVSERRIKLADKLTVVESTDGWMHLETGDIMFPGLVSVHDRRRSSSGKVVYVGTVFASGTQMPFRSTRFRRDPVAVVETVLVKHVPYAMPAFHPRIVPYVADLAIYFGRS